MSERHQIWLIDEGHGGHRVQSEGMLQALAGTGLEFDVAYIPCTLKIRGLARPVARRIFSRLNARQALRMCRWIADFSLPNTRKPSLIISSGGRTAFVSRALALAYDVPNVLVGNLKPFPANWFRAVLSPVERPAAPEAIITQIIPNKVTPEVCREKAEAFWAKPPKNCWAMLIGGANRNHLFSHQDWADIAHAMNALAEKHGIKWVATSSRRSGKAVEQIFAKTLKPEAVEQMVFQSTDGRPVVMPMLGAADLVFVTQDSVTMLSEAIASAKPVVSVAPRKVDVHPKNYMGAILRQFNEFEAFYPVTTSELAGFSPPEVRGENNDLARRALDKAARELRTKLLL